MTSGCDAWFLYTAREVSQVMEDIITAEQAAKAAEGLTFENVWAALMETRAQMKETDAQIKQMQENTQKQIDDLSKNIGGLGNSIGRLTEALFSAELVKKFNDIGYMFTKEGRNTKFHENGKVIAEADFFLENGDYVMPVEVKTDLTIRYIDRHLERIKTIRRYMDTKFDVRKIIGAVAGGFVPDNVLSYAQENGLFVVVQTGESVAIANTPAGFILREW
jgi:hypothetical protein